MESIYYYCDSMSMLFFFFQAEDGIRDLTVTGVQTCALPICLDGVAHRRVRVGVRQDVLADRARFLDRRAHLGDRELRGVELVRRRHGPAGDRKERRVGKECRSRWSPYH